MHSKSNVHTYNSGEYTQNGFFAVLVMPLFILFYFLFACSFPFPIHWVNIQQSTRTHTHTRITAVHVWCVSACTCVYCRAMPCNAFWIELSCTTCMPYREFIFVLRIFVFLVFLQFSWNFYNFTSFHTHRRFWFSTVVYGWWCFLSI